MVITIDGPAGAGKSSIAKRLAEELGFEFLDTGAMYRAVTWLAMQEQVAWSDTDRLEYLARHATIMIERNQVSINGQVVTEEIRTREITACVKHVADEPRVRHWLVLKQRELVGSQNYVTEGRDQGTAAFPNAEFKFFLTASPEERARRRLHQLEAKHQRVTFEELLAEQNLRDARDSSRSVGPLVRPADAIEIKSDGMSLEQVLDCLVSHVRNDQPRVASG